MPIIPENGVTKCVKCFDLTSPEAIAKDGGAIIGSPTFSKDGCNMDGTNDYITYAIPNTLLGSAQKLSIVVEFTPDFDTDEDANKYLFSSTANAYRVFKRSNVQDNTLSIELGDTVIALVAEETYSPVWKTNGRNILVISATSGDTNAWLNGTQILTNDGTAWTPSDDTELVIGAEASGGYKLDGEIHSISIYNDLLTAEDAQALYDNSLFNFQNKASIWLDMESQYGSSLDSSELLADGDMEAAGTSDWEEQGCSATKQTDTPYEGNRYIRVERTGSTAQLRQDVLTTGKRYRITGWARSDGTSVPKIYTSGDDHWTGSTSTDWQRIDATFTATGSYIGLYAGINVGYYTEWDNLSVKEVLQYTPDKSGNGNHMTLADGSDTTRMPTFKNPGFETDGDDYMLSTTTGIIDPTATELSVVMVFDVANYEKVSCFLDYSEPDLSNIGMILQQSTSNFSAYLGDAGGTNAASIDNDLYSSSGKCVLIATQDGSTNSIWIDNIKGADAINPLSTNLNDDQRLCLFVRNNLTGSDSSDGQAIYHVSMYPFKLTATQRRQLTSYLKNKYN